MKDEILTDGLDEIDAIDAESVDDMFSDLEALLADHHAKYDKAKTLKDKRQELVRTRDSGLSEQLQREIVELELTISYIPIALVARFNKQECACGASHTQLDGLYYHSKGSNGCLRWTRTETPHLYKHLPKKTECAVMQVNLCTACAGLEGFLFEPTGE